MDSERLTWPKPITSTTNALCTALVHMGSDPTSRDMWGPDCNRCSQSSTNHGAFTQLATSYYWRNSCASLDNLAYETTHYRSPIGHSADPFVV
jgi:hypothetical protein